jgi:hypothetical protein
MKAVLREEVTSDEGTNYPPGTEVVLVEPAGTSWIVEFRVPDESVEGDARYEHAEVSKDVLDPLVIVVAYCTKCGSEINRAESVPKSRANAVAMGAPLVAFCRERSHNTFSDCNFAVRTEIIEEEQWDETFLADTDCDHRLR